MDVVGTIVDIVGRRLYSGRIKVSGERIASICDLGEVSIDEARPPFIMPGLVDGHVHIESSMLTPSEFARVAVRHGTLGAAVDPHEMANVLGVDGVRLMMDMGDGVPFAFGWGVPSCVPATPLETAGGVLGPSEVRDLLQDPRTTHIGEVMDVRAVVSHNPEMAAKLAAAKAVGKRIDGHAPLLSGADLSAYVADGVSTDHEASSEAEAREKIAMGMIVQLRNGSAARNLPALWPVLMDASGMCHFCSDDKHPDDLLAGHVNKMVAYSLAQGVPLFNALGAASVNPIRHYRLPLGLLQVGDTADFIVVSDIASMTVAEAWYRGRKLTDGDFAKGAPCNANNFAASAISPDALPPVDEVLPAIEAFDGSLITGRVAATPDMPKIAVLSRYVAGAKPSVAHICGIGEVKGAIAASISHDSHNVVCAGANDRAILAAMNCVIASRGGLAVADGDGNVVAELALPIAGLMSDRPAEEVATGYVRCAQAAKSVGFALAAPFMTLSFLSLPVIPHLKITAGGLFDVDEWRFL